MLGPDVAPAAFPLPARRRRADELAHSGLPGLRKRALTCYLESPSDEAALRDSWALPTPTVSTAEMIEIAL